MEYFRAYKAHLPTEEIPTYFIESTAPDNVDDTEAHSIAQELEAIGELGPLPGQASLKRVGSNQAVEEIAGILAKAESPNLVVMVHGFNNRELDVLKTYVRAASTIYGDGLFSERKGLVCVGYRWPSEGMGMPLGSSWSALPVLPMRVLLLGAALFGLSLLLFWALPIFAVGSPPTTAVTIIFHAIHYTVSWVAHLGFMFAWILIGLILMMVLLRAIVYFRDNYRATNYGVPDLVQIIRAIEGQILKQRGDDAKDVHDVELSFIGHSMGSLVVTNTIRTLTDVFRTKVSDLNHFGAAAPKPGKEKQNIGHVFVLKRFVLASPDIPAEALLSDRGNFLASVLSRFEEAYLFSNEGDEVLRLISTLVNYFVFPSSSADHGFRLGNTEILSEGYGIIDRGANQDDFLAKLRIGKLTLSQLYARLVQAESRRQSGSQPRVRTLLPEVFTYFDCTDYCDVDDSGTRGPLLTFAKRFKRNSAVARIPFSENLQLLWAYSARRKPNCHGGYFEGKLSQQLIYRLACLGYHGTMATSFDDNDPFDKACEKKQIRVLLSPALHKTGQGPAMARLRAE
jgi:hypothetical protein